MSVFSTIADFLDDHKSEISFGAGIILTGATTVLAVKATPKAMEDIRQAEEELGPLTKWQKVKVCWKRYIAPAITEAAGLTCLFFGKSVDIKATNTALEVANVSQKLLKEYSGKVIEEIGEKKEEDIRRKVVSKRGAEVSLKASEDCSLLDGDAWYVDTMLGKKFVASEQKIQAAINYINNRLNCDDTASYNDFYEEIYNQTPIPVNKDLLYGDFGDFFGFRRDGGLVAVDFERRDEGVTVNGMTVPAFNIIFTYRDTCRTRFPEFLGGID